MRLFYVFSLFDGHVFPQVSAVHAHSVQWIISLNMLASKLDVTNSKCKWSAPMIPDLGVMLTGY